MRVSTNAADRLLHLPPPAGAYRTPLGIDQECRALVDLHCGRGEVAGSTREGRSIPLYRFGPDSTGGVLLLALLHASEWIGPMALLELARRLLADRPGLPLALLPTCNPDGAARAERSALERISRLDRGNAAGVDLNRNFPPTHRSSGFWSSLPPYRPGPFPSSEPETEAIVALARRLRPRLAISFHSFGRWIFYPPGCPNGASESAAVHREMLDRAGGAASIGYRARPLARWSPWFRARGTEIDFFDSIGSMAYLIELSRGGIGRWGIGRIAIPFFAFNPPDPGHDVRVVADLGSRMVAAVMG